jgi:hypothetical protein
MNLYVIEAERPRVDKTMIKEVQYVVAGSLRTALNWVTRTGTPEEEIVGIRCVCPVVAILPEETPVVNQLQDLRCACGQGTVKKEN